MAAHLKPLADQTVVITGASSGIGLATARMAASRGERTGPSSGDLRERGGYEDRVAKSSLYTQAVLHPVMTGAALAGLAAGLVWGVMRDGA